MATAAGVQQVTNNLIPPLYATTWNIEFYAQVVVQEICNHDHEGEFANQGDKLLIRQRAPITIKDHSVGQQLSYDEMTFPDPIEFNIDQGLEWDFPVYDITRFQSDMDYVTREAAEGAAQMKIKCDSRVLGSIPSDAHASNQGATAGVISGDIDLGVSGTPRSVTKTNLLEVLIDCGTVLTEQNVPEEGRWVVIPASFEGLLLKGDLKNADLTGDAVSPARNGRVGMIRGMTVYMSNLLTRTTDGSDSVYNAIFGHPSAVTFASQISKQETLKNPDTFGDLYRALKIFGWKTVKPEALGWLYAVNA
jgi:hypothetical protein